MKNPPNINTTENLAYHRKLNFSFTYLWLVSNSLSYLDFWEFCTSVHHNHLLNFRWYEGNWKARIGDISFNINEENFKKFFGALFERSEVRSKHALGNERYYWDFEFSSGTTSLRNMVQEFMILKCFSCATFQVHQVSRCDF